MLAETRADSGEDVNKNIRIVVGFTNNYSSFHHKSDHKVRNYHVFVDQAYKKGKKMILESIYYYYYEMQLTVKKQCLPATIA